MVMNALPWDIEDQLGEIREVEELCPNAYYVAAKDAQEPSLFSREYIVIDSQLPLFSDEAKAYGKEAGGALIYPMEPMDSGHVVIEYEIGRYRVQHGMPKREGYSLYVTAQYGCECHPEYFGYFPVPIETPRGRQTRYKVVDNGIYTMETDTGENLMAICYPIWEAEISEYTQHLALKNAYDEAHDINKTLGYLFFKRDDWCLPIFELLITRSEWVEKQIVDEKALMNEIWRTHPEFAASYNVQEQAGLNDSLGMLLKTFGCEVELIGSTKNIIALHPDAGTTFLNLRTDRSLENL